MKNTRIQETVSEYDGFRIVIIHDEGQRPYYELREKRNLLWLSHYWKIVG